MQVKFRASLAAGDAHFSKKQQSVITQKIHETEIPALLDSWVTNTPLKILCPQKICLFSYFHKTLNNMQKCWTTEN